MCWVLCRHDHSNLWHSIPIFEIKTMRFGKYYTIKGSKSQVSSRNTFQILFCLAPVCTMDHVPLWKPLSCVWVWPCTDSCAKTSPAADWVRTPVWLSTPMSYCKWGFSFSLLLIYNKTYVSPLPIIVYNPLTRWLIFNPEKTTLISQI